jgi:hypothetical protein
MSDSNQASDSAVGDQGLQQVAPTAENVALVLAAAGLSCASGSHVAYAAGMASLNLLFMAVFAALLSSIGTRLFPSTQTEAPLRGKATQQTFAGAAQLGGALFTIFFTMIGEPQLVLMHGCCSPCFPFSLPTPSLPFQKPGSKLSALPCHHGRRLLCWLTLSAG